MCDLDECDTELAPHQDKYCGKLHRDRNLKRQSRAYLMMRESSTRSIFGFETCDEVEFCFRFDKLKHSKELHARKPCSGPILRRFDRERIYDREKLVEGRGLPGTGEYCEHRQTTGTFAEWVTADGTEMSRTRVRRGQPCVTPSDERDWEFDFQSRMRKMAQTPIWKHEDRLLRLRNRLALEESIDRAGLVTIRNIVAVVINEDAVPIEISA
jgi:hypothetical protein